MDSCAFVLHPVHYYALLRGLNGAETSPRIAWTLFCGLFLLSIEVMRSWTAVRSALLSEYALLSSCVADASAGARLGLDQALDQTRGHFARSLALQLQLRMNARL
jgi:hypothetical protein